MTEIIGPLAVILSICIGYAVSAHCYGPKKPTREQLRRQIEDAERRHGPRKHIRKLFVQATCEQIKRECA